MKAAYNLDFGAVGHAGDSQGSLVSQGALGVVRHCEQPVRVEWLGRDLAETVVQKEQIQKCPPREFISVGDVVRATRDLVFEMNLVTAGALGTVTSCDNETIVRWIGFDTLGRTSLAQEDFVKCNPWEYLSAGDIVKASCKLDFQACGISGDAMGTTVSEGSLGSVASIAGGISHACIAPLHGRP